MMILYATTFLSGLLTSLSPCILPLAPILLLSAWQQHRLGPLALLVGLSTTFTTIGVIFSATGFAFGISQEGLSAFSSVILILFGLMLIIERIESQWAMIVAPLAHRFQLITDGTSNNGLIGQFFLGMLMAGAWMPCIGPTLWLAIKLSQQQNHLLKSILMMLIFSLGAALPFIAISYLSREVFAGHKNIWIKVAQKAKRTLGTVLLAVGSFSFLGWLDLIQGWLVVNYPAWLIYLTTSF